jgi:hypothetical protein
MPIWPRRVFEAANAEDAFRYMQSGKHIGKILIQMPDRQEELPVSRCAQEASFSPQSSYLLVGGLGGLGKSISSWMVENGARELTFLSPFAGTTEDDQVFLQELESQGCRATAVSGDVAKMEDVQKAVAACTAPLAGVIQLSMVLRVCIWYASCG